MRQALPAGAKVTAGAARSTGDPTSPPEPADRHPELLDYQKLPVASEDRPVEDGRSTSGEGVGVAEPSARLDGRRPAHEGVVDVDPANQHSAGPALRPEVRPHLVGGCGAGGSCEELGNLSEVDERHPGLTDSHDLLDVGPVRLVAEESEHCVGIEDDAIRHPRAYDPGSSPPAAMPTARSRAGVRGRTPATGASKGSATTCAFRCARTSSSTTPPRMAAGRL
jgi:hypothetical protein